jgi:hypothetical protein
MCSHPLKGTKNQKTNSNLVGNSVNNTTSASSSSSAAISIPKDSTKSFNSNAATNGITELITIAMNNEKSIFKICSPCPHITQAGFEGFDFTCGYRNIQMLCHVLIQQPEYKNILFNKQGDIPDIYGLQSWIEKAWKDGFDQLGAEQLGWSLVGTKIWIGATECVALLRYFGVRCKVIQFQSYKLKIPKSTSTTNGHNPTTNSTATSSSSSSNSSSSSSNNNNTSNGIKRYFHQTTAAATTDESSSIGESNSLDYDDPDFDWNQFLSQNASSNNNHTTNATNNRNSNNTSSNVNSNNNNSNNNNNETIINIIMDDQSDNSQDDYNPNARPTITTTIRTSKRTKKTPIFYTGENEENGSKKTGHKNNIGNKSNSNKVVTDVGRSLGNWVKDYFARSVREEWTCVPPLYFQHDGHSRTIIGKKVLHCD